jgi:hypothetical protein
MTLLALPAMQSHFAFTKERSLLGYTAEAAPLEASLEQWIGGRFQTAAENAFNEQIGFRGHLIRAENQLNFSLFGDISSRTQTKIVLGKDHYLYEKAYIDAYNGVDAIAPEILEEKITSLKELQEKAEKKGVAFILLIAPSKASVYPEFIPERYLLKKESRKTTNYEQLIPLLDAYGINYFDANAFLIEQKKERPYDVFSRGGTHWNYYTACFVSKEFVEMLERIAEINLVNVSCDSVVVDTKATGTDRDLTDLTNLIDDSAIDGEIAHPIFHVSAKEGEQAPDILFVGDSFMHTILAIMEHGPMYKSRDLYYYYNTAFKKPENTAVPINRDAIDWERDIFSKDIIVIEVSQTGIPELGFGFIEDAVR